MNNDRYRKLPEAEIFPSTIKSAALTAGALFLYNKGKDNPVIGPLLGAYRMAIHKLVSILGGKNFDDISTKDTAAISLLDFVTLAGGLILIGRTPIGPAIKNIAENIGNLFNQNKEK